MGKEGGRFGGIVENLRGMTRGEIHERQYPQIQRLIDEFHGMCPSAPPVPKKGPDKGQDKGQNKGRDKYRDKGQDNYRDRSRDEGRDKGRDKGDPAEWSAAANRLALSLSVLASRTESSDLQAICLDGMVRMGPYGIILAVHHILDGMFSVKNLDTLYKDATPGVRYGLLDRLLRHAARLDQPLREFTLKGLKDLKDPEETQAYLSSAAKEGNPPCFALETALVDGPFRELFIAGINEPASAQALTEWLGMAPSRLPPEATKAVAGHLQSDNVADLPVFMTTAARFCPPTPTLTKTLTSFLAHQDKKVKAASLDALARLHPRHLPAIYAMVFNKMPSLRKAVIPRLAILGWEEFRSFLESVEKTYHRGILWMLFVSLAKLDPKTLSESLDQCARRIKDPEIEKTTKGLRSQLPAKSVSPVKEPEAPRQEKKAAPLEDDGEKSSFLGGLFGAGKKGGSGDALVSFGDSPSSSKQSSSSGVITKQTYEDETFEGRSHRKTFFIKTRFRKCRFSGGFLNGAVFKECIFENVEFENCDLTEAKWFRCKLKATAFRFCLMDQTVFSRTRVLFGLFKSCTLGKARISESLLKSVRLEMVDFSRGRVDETSWHGVELTHCLLPDAAFHRLTERCTRVESSDFRNCRVSEISAIHPDLVALDREGFSGKLPVLAEKLSTATLPPPPGPAGERLAARTVDRWFSLKSLQRIEKTFLGNNTRRVEWGMEKLGKAKADFYRMVPLLLATNAFEKANNLPEAPLFHIDGFEPDYAAIQAAKKYFPDADLFARDPEGIPLEGLYTIGSLGTVAQGKGSDLDYWVCCPLKEVAPEKAKALSVKLEALTDWADKDLDLEAYFFLMDTGAVRDNNFGFSDKESSGSAQALLLKEEFYRSAVLVAGRPPIWWFTPPDTDDAGYARVKTRLADHFGPEYAADLGHVAEVPQNEFFGASLWQIVKGLKSPFKSILKFALLECYTSGENRESALLCDRIKKHLLAGSHILWDIDPYVAMFREVAEYYRAAGNETNVELVTMAFSLKVERQGSDGFALPFRREEEDLEEIFRNPRYAGGTKAAAMTRDISFHDLLKLGARINKFMVNTYIALRENQSAETKAMITPEDMTKLGRKISTFFSMSENKIERIPILKIKSDLFIELHLMVRYVGKDRIWELKGGGLDEVTNRIKITDLKSSPDLLPLLAWATVNHLYHPDIPLKVDRTAHPMQEEDMRELMQALTEFVTDKKTFETDISENLNPEVVARAFFAFNLATPREEGKLKEASVLYSTNWGELFFQTLPVTGNLLTADPLQVLVKSLSKKVMESPEMDGYTPTKGRCPNYFANKH